MISRHQSIAKSVFISFAPLFSPAINNHRSKLDLDYVWCAMHRVIFNNAQMKWFEGIRSLLAAGVSNERTGDGDGRNSRNVTSAAIGPATVADPRLSLVRPQVARALRTAHRGSTVTLSHTCDMTSASCRHLPLCYYKEFYEEDYILYIHKRFNVFIRADFKNTTMPYGKSLSS